MTLKDGEVAIEKASGKINSASPLAGSNDENFVEP